MYIKMTIILYLYWYKCYIQFPISLLSLLPMLCYVSLSVSAIQKLESSVFLSLCHDPVDQACNFFLCLKVMREKSGLLSEIVLTNCMCPFSPNAPRSCLLSPLATFLTLSHAHLLFFLSLPPSLCLLISLHTLAVFSLSLPSD